MNRFGFFICAVVVLLAHGASYTHADESAPSSASYAFTGPTHAILGTPFHITVLVHSPSEPINAVQGIILFPAHMLTVEHIYTTNSIIQYWQHTPNADTTTGHISFAGGLPTPGFQGENGTLFTIVARPTAVGTIAITSGQKSILLANDTKGTILNTRQASLTVSSQEQTQTETSKPLAQREDTTPPTQLELRAGKDISLFNHKWFAAFQAVDAESGIDHYEIAETNLRTTYPTEQDWVRTQSPHILHNQTKRGRIFFKAVDKAGNAAVMSIPFNPCPTLPWWLLLCLGILIALCLRAGHTYNKQATKTERT